MSDAEQSADRPPVRGYIDGCFDIMHSGHYNAIRQARYMIIHHTPQSPTILHNPPESIRSIALILDRLCDMNGNDANDACCSFPFSLFHLSVCVVASLSGEEYL